MSILSPLGAGLAIAVLVVLSTVLAVLLTRRGARVKALSGQNRVDPAEFGAVQLGAVGTVVQFSTEYCARCPGAERLLHDLVSRQDGVTFLHVDVTHNPHLVKKYRVLQTPTVLFIDDEGTQRTRVSGIVTRPALVQQITALTGGAA